MKNSFNKNPLSTVFEPFGLFALRGRATAIDRSKGCPHGSELMDDSHIVFLEVFDLSGKFVGHPGIEVARETDRSKKEGAYGKFYPVRVVYDGGLWGKDFLPPEKLRELSPSSEIAKTMLAEFETCDRAMQELMKAPENTLQAVVAGC